METDEEKIARIKSHTMTKKELIKKLQELDKDAQEHDWSKDGKNPEDAHVAADRALLEYIGDKEVTRAFSKIDKLYA